MKTYGMVVVMLLGVFGCNSRQANARSSSALSSVAVQTLKPRAMEILRSSLKDENPYLRAPAVEVVVQTGQKEMMSEITQRMDDSTVAVRFAAIVAAGDMQCFGCEQAVRKHLTSEDENIRLAAAYSLYKLNDVSSHAVLRQGLNHADSTVRANAALLLGKLGNKENIPLLYGLLKDQTADDKVRIQAVESIARLKDVRIYRGKLWALMISEYADDRVMGILGMAELGTVDAKNAIATMLTDDVPEIRLIAAEQLGRLGDTSGHDEIAGYLDKLATLNQSDFGTVTAVRAIGRIGTPELIAYLPKALNSDSAIVRLTAAQSVLLLAR